MSIIKILYSTVLDALFPISKAEMEVLGMDGNKAFHTLPRAKKSPIREACSIFSYKDERVWRLIWGIKYKRSLIAARIAGFALFQTLSMYVRAAFPVIIIPMPITAKRRRERGFNQCELIIDEIEKLAAKSDIADRLNFTRDLLLRSRHKSRQTLKDREERLESAHDIFEVSKNAVEKLKVLQNFPNHLLIVIDDVVTTGSTIREAVNTLRKAGFEKTFGLSVAH
jgi:predicted amidophosphoribosyltransferase